MNVTYARRKELGLCPSCGSKPEPGYRYCECCRKKTNTLQHKRKEAGLCPQCGETPEPGHIYCKFCRTKNSQRNGSYNKKYPAKSEATKAASRRVENALSLSDVVKMADKLGVSYGQMVVIIERGGYNANS